MACWRILETTPLNAHKNGEFTLQDDSSTTSNKIESGVITT